MDLKNNKITVGELMDHPGARAVFQKRFPMVMKHPLLGAARTVTLEQILGGLLSAGFKLLDIKEARPSEKDMEFMKDEMRRPMMLLVRAGKE